MHTGRLELLPLIDVRQLFLNGRLERDPQLSEYYVGVSLVLCLEGSIFGHNGSPVYWIKNEEHFSDSILFSSEHEHCHDYFGEVGSSLETINRSGGRVQSFINLYRSDICMVYSNRFIAILLIRSLKIDDNGLYDFHLEDQRGVALASGQMLLHNIGKP